MIWKEIKRFLRVALRNLHRDEYNENNKFSRSIYKAFISIDNVCEAECLRAGREEEEEGWSAVMKPELLILTVQSNKVEH